MNYCITPLTVIACIVISRIEVDGKRFGHAEHAIESFHTKPKRKTSTNKLLNCVPNIGVACSTCNTSFKSTGEREFIFESNDIQSFKKSVCREPQKCHIECKAYRKIKQKYIVERKINLQPMGVLSNNKEFLLQYNLLKLEFEPRSNLNYLQQDFDFISEHIKKFNLNDGRFRTRELLIFCKDYIHDKAQLEKGKYNNFIVDLFIEKLITLTPDKRLKLCQIVTTIGLMKGII